MSLKGRLRTDPYTALSAGVFMVAAYLCLVNLDYTGFWHDEAPVASIGRNLLEQGSIVGWDGRNLIAGPNANELNEDLYNVFPPFQYVATALGFTIFGFNETGARVVHALAGLLALGFFWFILRQHLPDCPRLRLFAFLFAAWSAQLLLYFRQARYYAVAALCLTAGFYLYERYWQTKSLRHLATLTAVAALAFFNHYAIGTASMLALAACHLIFRRRETTRREWAAFAACGGVVVVLGLAYLASIGLIGGDRDARQVFLTRTFEEHQDALFVVPIRLWLCVRDLFAADWVSWPVLLWLAGCLAYRWKSGDKDGLPVAACCKMMLPGALFAVFYALLSQQPVMLAGVQIDLRHYVAALPFLLLMKGLFVEWVWQKSKTAALAVCAVLLFTSAGAWPFNIVNFFTGESTLGFHLFRFVQEIHRPYRDSHKVIADYPASTRRTGRLRLCRRRTQRRPRHPAVLSRPAREVLQRHR